jgi:hypothetical protein
MTTAPDAAATESAAARPMDEYASVREWDASFRHFWRSEAPPAAWKDALARFVASCGADPDAIINEVLQPAPSGEGVLLRTRARRKYVQLIEEFERAEGRQAANAVRSFMIHNGVAMAPSILR